MSGRNSRPHIALVVPPPECPLIWDDYSVLPCPVTLTPLENTGQLFGRMSLRLPGDTRHSVIWCWVQSLFPWPVLPLHASSACGRVAHVSAAVGCKHGCGTVVDEEVIAGFSEPAALELPAAAARDRERQHQDWYLARLSSLQMSSVFKYWNFTVGFILNISWPH